MQCLLFFEILKSKIIIIVYLINLIMNFVSLLKNNKKKI